MSSLIDTLITNNTTSHWHVELEQRLKAVVKAATVAAAKITDKGAKGDEPLKERVSSFLHESSKTSSMGLSLLASLVKDLSSEAFALPPDFILNSVQHLQQALQQAESLSLFQDWSPPAAVERSAAFHKDKNVATSVYAGNGADKAISRSRDSYWQSGAINQPASWTGELLEIETPLTSISISWPAFYRPAKIVFFVEENAGAGGEEAWLRLGEVIESDIPSGVTELKYEVTTGAHVVGKHKKLKIELHPLVDRDIQYVALSRYSR